MNIQSLEESGVTVLVLDGRLETNTASVFDQSYNKAFADGSRKFVLDCSGLSYISSAGLRSFLKALKQLGASGGELAIAAPRSMVLEVLEMSGFKPLLTITSDRAAAVSAMT